MIYTIIEDDRHPCDSVLPQLSLIYQRERKIKSEKKELKKGLIGTIQMNYKIVHHRLIKSFSIGRIIGNDLRFDFLEFDLICFDEWHGPVYSVCEHSRGS